MLAPTIADMNMTTGTFRAQHARDLVLGAISTDPRYMRCLVRHTDSGIPDWDELLADESWSEGERVLLRTAAALGHPLGGNRQVLVSELLAFLDRSTLRRVFDGLASWQGWQLDGTDDDVQLLRNRIAELEGSTRSQAVQLAHYRSVLDALHTLRDAYRTSE